MEIQSEERMPKLTVCVSSCDNSYLYLPVPTKCFAQKYELFLPVFLLGIDGYVIVMLYLRYQTGYSSVCLGMHLAYPHNSWSVDSELMPVLKGLCRHALHCVSLRPRKKLNDEHYLQHEQTLRPQGLISSLLVPPGLTQIFFKEHLFTKHAILIACSAYVTLSNHMFPLIFYLHSSSNVNQMALHLDRNSCLVQMRYNIMEVPQFSSI